jgi:hypothetical protein
MIQEIKYFLWCFFSTIKYYFGIVDSSKNIFGTSNYTDVVKIDIFNGEDVKKIRDPKYNYHSPMGSGWNFYLGKNIKGIKLRTGSMELLDEKTMLIKGNILVCDMIKELEKHGKELPCRGSCIKDKYSQEVMSCIHNNVHFSCSPDFNMCSFDKKYINYGDNRGNKILVSAKLMLREITFWKFSNIFTKIQKNGEYYELLEMFKEKNNIYLVQIYFNPITKYPYINIHKSTKVNVIPEKIEQFSEITKISYFRSFLYNIISLSISLFPFFRTHLSSFILTINGFIESFLTEEKIYSFMTTDPINYLTEIWHIEAEAFVLPENALKMMIFLHENKITSGCAIILRSVNDVNGKLKYYCFNFDQFIQSEINSYTRMIENIQGSELVDHWHTGKYSPPNLRG